MSTRALFRRWLGSVDILRFRANVIPNPRAFGGVRDLLSAYALRSAEDVKQSQMASRDFRAHEFVHAVSTRLQFGVFYLRACMGQRKADPPQQVLKTLV